MTTVSTLLNGLVIGFSIAAPVGPIGVYCIRTTLVRGRLAGLCAGLGAAMADGCYGLVVAGAPPVAGLARVFCTTFLLTLSNPMTILSFVAILGAVGAGASGGPFALVAGVFLGSALWWLSLSLLVGLFRARVTPRVMRCVNTGAGGLIAGFGVWVPAGALRG